MHKLLLEPPRDLVPIAREHRRRAAAVVEADERVRDDEPALGQVVAGCRERHGRLESRHVVVGEVADDRLAERFGLLERDDARPGADERVPPQPSLLHRLEQEAGATLAAQAEIGAERRQEVGRDLGRRHRHRLPAVAIPRLLDALLRAHGPTGHEHLAFDAVREGLGDAVVETDAVGNLVARATGETGPPKLALFAHLDVVGLAVSHIADDGLLSVHTLVPAPAAVAYGQRVEIRAATGVVPGVIARRSSDAEKIEWSNLYVDIGARSAKEARALVAEGDPMVLFAPPVELAGGRIASRSLDNRAGVYVALEAFRRLGGEGIAVVAAAHEELGGHGAQVASASASTRGRARPRRHLRHRRPVAAMCTTPAPTVSAEARRSSVGPTVHPRVFELLVDAARAEGIDYTVETGAKTATDADSVFASRDGIPTGVVSIPLRNMHSPIEIVELADLEATIRLVVAFAKLLEPGASYAR